MLFVWNTFVNSERYQDQFKVLGEMGLQVRETAAFQSSVLWNGQEYIFSYVEWDEKESACVTVGIVMSLLA